MRVARGGRTIPGTRIVPPRLCLTRRYRHEVDGERVWLSWCERCVMLNRVVETAVQRDHLTEGRARRSAGRQARIPVAQKRVQAPLQRPRIKSETYHIVESPSLELECREVVG